MGSRLTDLPKKLTVAPEGDAIVAVGRYIQGVALQAFEDLGGQETFNKWAKEHYSDFAGKFLAKMLPRCEAVAPKTKTVEDFLEELDKRVVDVTPSSEGDEDHEAGS